MAKIDENYHELLETIFKKGFTYEDPNRKGINRLQLSSYQFKYNFKDGFPAITTKELYWKGVVGELLWILRGDTNIKYLVDNKINIWNKDAYNWYLKACEYCDLPKLTLKEFIIKVKEGKSTTFSGYPYYGEIGRGYGAQLRDWKRSDPDFNFGFDQLQKLINTLRTNPLATKKTVTFWNPDEGGDCALTPCHWSFEILVEPLKGEERAKLNSATNLITDTFENNYAEGYLDSLKIPKYKFKLKWHQHSVDTFLGLPFNIASYALLAHIIGKLTNTVPESIIGDLSNVHIYEPHLDAVKEQLSRSTNMFNSKCELEEFTGFKMGMHNDVSQWLSSKDIKDFNLTKYSTQPAIKAEMLPYSK